MDTTVTIASNMEYVLLHAWLIASGIFDELKTYSKLGMRFLIISYIGDFMTRFQRTVVYPSTYFDKW